MGHEKMENTQRLWILYAIVLSSKFFTAERHLILGRIKLNQHKYFKTILTPKFESWGVWNKLKCIHSIPKFKGQKKKDGSKRKFLAIISYINKMVWFHTSDLIVHIKGLKKEEENHTQKEKMTRSNQI